MESEQGILGSVLLLPQESMAEAASKITNPDAFYDQRHRTIWQTMLEMYEDEIVIDTITLSARLKAFGRFDAVGAAAFLSALPDGIPSAANILYYINVVMEKFQLRKMIQLCTNTIAKIYEHEGEVDSLIDEFEAEALKVRTDVGDTVRANCKETVDVVIGTIDNMMQNPGIITGVPTGFVDFDKMTMGLQPGEVTVIAARPSMGKSSIAMNIVEYLTIEQNTPVGVFSLEMSKESLIMRSLGSRARVNMRNIREGFLAERDLPKLVGAAGKLRKAPLYIDDSPGLSIIQLRARARRMHQQFGIKLFVIDYLQLLQAITGKNTSREREIADISNGTKRLARELKVPVIVIAQLNRDLERDKKRKPRLADLRESGAIEQDADVVGLLYKPNVGDDDADEQDAIAVNLLIAKQRNGPTGDVHLTFLRSYTRYESAAKVSDADVPVDDR